MIPYTEYNKILLPQVKAVLPEHEQAQTVDILINRERGIIEKVAPDIPVSSDAVQKIDRLTGMMVMPGFIDPHVHFRSPGKEAAENWRSGSMAALYGGITAVLDMPNTTPPTVDLATYHRKKGQAKLHSRINYGFYGGLTSDNLAFLLEMPQFRGIKVYLATTTGDLLIHNIEENFLRFKVKESGKVITFHSEDEAILEQNARKMGPLKSAEMHSQIRSEEAAVKSTEKLLQLHKKTGGRFHIAHVSTADEIDMLNEYGMSFEVAPHHIFLNTDDYKTKHYQIKCNPPVRSTQTTSELLRLLHQEKIPMIATDHAPHLKEEKMRTEPVPPSGVPSIQVGTHFILNEMAENRISPAYTAGVLSTNAAEFFGLENRGKIKEGYWADLTVIDPDLGFIFREKDVLSSCGWTPFDGNQFSAKVLSTFVSGFEYQSDRLFDLFNQQDDHNYWWPAYEL